MHTSIVWQGRVARIALLVFNLGGLWGCEPARLPARGTINSPQALAFRCVYPAPEDDAGVASGILNGVPVEGCGCTVREPTGEVRQMGRVECRCAVQTTAGLEQHG